MLARGQGPSTIINLAVMFVDDFDASNVTMTTPSITNSPLSVGSGYIPYIYICSQPLATIKRWHLAIFKGSYSVYDTATKYTHNMAPPNLVTS